MNIVTYARGTGTLVVLLTRGITQLNQLVLGIRSIGIEPVREILDAILPAELKLKTPVLHRTKVTVRLRLSDVCRNVQLKEHIRGLLIVVVEAKAQTAVQEAHVNTDIGLCRSLPLDIRVSSTCR